MSEPMREETTLDGPAVQVWLLVVLGMILAMVVVGGITRLTGSGLSMVEWRPLMGVLPPIGDAAWNEVFDQYKQSPQYQQVNDWMQLADFKRIFFWEYVHRLFGRLIGVVVILPLVYFLALGRMTPRTRNRSLVAFFLGGLQGFLGWFMVRSGLVDVPEVSHFRLAAHLTLAFVVGLWVLWLYLDLRYGHERATGLSRSQRWAWSLLLVIFVQVVFGALMAGKDAGLLFSTFPDMNGAFLPGVFLTGTGWLRDLVDEPAVIHWVHRTLAYVVVLWTAYVVIIVRREEPAGSQARAVAHAAGGVVAVQFLLGVGTVVMAVPITLAVMHQAMAFVLVAKATWLIHALGRRARGVPKVAVTVA